MKAIVPFSGGVPEVLRFSRNGDYLIVGGGRASALGKVVVWNVRQARIVTEVGNELDTVLAADITSDHGLIALGGPGRVVRVFDTTTGEPVYELTKHTDWITSIEFSPDGVLLATGDRNGGLFIWEALTGRPYLTLKGHTGEIASLSWRWDSNLVASGSRDTTVRLWEVENGRQIKSWGAHGGGVSSIEFTRDGRIVSTGRDRVTKLWDQNGAQQRAFDAFPDLGLEVSFCDESGA